MTPRRHDLAPRTLRGRAVFGCLPIVLLLASAFALAGPRGAFGHPDHALAQTSTTSPASVAAAGSPPAGPFWVDHTMYGSAGGGFYWDPNSEQVWTHERGWHMFSPQFTVVIVVLWVNCPSYGSSGAGFYWDPRSGLVWTHERGWHRFNPSPYPYTPNPSPPNPYPPNPNPTSLLRIWTNRGDGSSYRAGENLRICYSVTAPGNIQIVDFPSDGTSHILLSGFDDGRGGCFNGQVTPPYGREVISIFVDAGSGPYSNPPGPYSTNPGPYSPSNVIPYPGQTPLNRADTYFFVGP